MGAHSTLQITESKAKEELIRQVTSFLSKEELERLMDIILDKRLYNCVIVPDWCGENDNNRL